ncbi:predicted protein [Naegleria gruberi]|uniref:Predicted protein n=1 Tax=Naegleria gruberi TaxID=5762 RepID=D2VMN8_NAEGR|nr:uncharacterized protein NAEGRDRAFT_70205 [Naegleria gruberi]EFC41766.1 predicted protein [Naegleria gruberi]|eukprot:XP_002674510.1 predicted protein [Naegleria gruberi strain NEG-M]
MHALSTSFLPIHEMIKCRRVNSLWKHSVHSDQPFWKSMFVNYYEIDQYFHYDDEDEDNRVHSCWLYKLLRILAKIPKKQINDHDEVFNPNSLECVKNYESLFSKVYPYDYCSSAMVVNDEQKVSFKFNEEISKTSVLEVLDHFLIVIIYDALTLSGYTPNLLIDKLMVQLYDFELTKHVVKTIPLLTFLTCFFKVESYRNNCFKLAKKLFSVECLDNVCVGLNMENFVGLIEIGEMTNPNTTFIDEELLEDPCSEFRLSLCEGSIIPSYFNAGGGWIDSADTSLRVNSQDGSIVDVERLSTRQFY